MKMFGNKGVMFGILLLLSITASNSKVYVEDILGFASPLAKEAENKTQLKTIAGVQVLLNSAEEVLAKTGNKTLYNVLQRFYTDAADYFVGQMRIIFSADSKEDHAIILKSLVPHLLNCEFKKNKPYNFAWYPFRRLFVQAFLEISNAEIALVHGQTVNKSYVINKITKEIEATFALQPEVLTEFLVHLEIKSNDNMLKNLSAKLAAMFKAYLDEVAPKQESSALETLNKLLYPCVLVAGAYAIYQIPKMLDVKTVLGIINGKKSGQFVPPSLSGKR